MQIDSHPFYVLRVSHYKHDATSHKYRPILLDSSSFLQKGGSDPASIDYIEQTQSTFISIYLFSKGHDNNFF
jgi:hypothetical protein